MKISGYMGLASLTPSLSSCDETDISGGIVGANAAVGHRLRAGDFGPVTDETRTGVVVVGGGVAGLSAGRFLKKQTDNFLLLEMDVRAGGNAASGENEVTRFPWGAHYLPIPSNGDQELLSFLADAGVITGIKNGLPIYNEYYLCHDPKERLFINQYWQEGLVPHEGVPARDRDEIQRFIAMMHTYASATGRDRRPAFAIPLAHSSQDEKYTRLDHSTAEDFLNTNNFRSPYLRWYVNYCCADDYGSNLADTSAWAMIHYFASRRGKGFNDDQDAVLTWPEGNAFLTEKLSASFTKHIRTNSLAYEVRPTAGGVEVLYFDVERNASRRVVATSCIMATPQFINTRILKAERPGVDSQAFAYAPWMVANIRTSHPLTERRGERLSWDNVIYGSDGLGYVNATHQQVRRRGSETVITYYKPILGNVTHARQYAHARSFAQWRNDILEDLSKPHPHIGRYISNIDIWIWGHGMIKPKPGLVWGDDRRNARKPVQEKIFFAHSDLSGVSLFEEAFYHGHKAAMRVLEYG